jgi:hypothetical protein
MTVITVVKKQARRAPEDVLGVKSGASPRGSTYYSRIRRCPREHGLYHEAMLVPQGDKEALTLGWLFHHALEVYYRTIQHHQHLLFGGALAWTRDHYKGQTLVEMTATARAAAMDAIRVFASEPGYDETYAQLQKMLDGYFEEYMSDRWYIIAVEEQLATTMPFEYTARLDLVVVDLDEDVLRVVEHKSARSFTADLLAGYQLNLQIMGQAWLLLKCVDLSKYPTFAGVTVNLTSKHKTPQFMRVPCAVSAQHLAAFEDSMIRWGRLAQAFANEGFPQDFTKCSGYARGYTMCAYYDLCYTRPADALDTIRQEVHNGGPPLGFKLRDGTDDEDEDD